MDFLLVQFDYTISQNKTLKSYAKENNVSYSHAFKKKRYILDKLFMYINSYIVLNKAKTKTSVC